MLNEFGTLRAANSTLTGAWRSRPIECLCVCVCVHISCPTCILKQPKQFSGSFSTHRRIRSVGSSRPRACKHIYHRTVYIQPVVSSKSLLLQQVNELETKIKTATTRRVPRAVFKAITSGEFTATTTVPYI